MEATPLTDQVDRRIHAIALRALDGRITETSARWEILSELLKAGVAMRAARRASNLDWQTRDDLAEEFMRLIEMKALQTTEGGLDLTRAAQTSVCGWAYNLCRVATASSLRNVRRPTVHHQQFVDPTIDITDDGAFGETVLAFHSAATVEKHDQDIDDAETVEAAESAWNETSAGRMHAADRLRLQAATLRAAFQLPAAIRPTNPLDREWLLQTLASDPGSALDGVQALHALVASREDSQQRDVDERLLSLWDDYSVDQLATLASKPAQVAQTLAADALQLLPRPNRDVVAAALAAVRMTSQEGNFTAWKNLTRDLVDSWLASETESVSPYMKKSVVGDPAKEMTRLADALAWSDRVEQMIQWPGAPLGTTEAQVKSFLARAFGVTAPASAEVASSADVTA